jgi:EAL domain-containing protein (putative c-di-GMP-specific phosphodiesterase class I)
MGICAVAEHVEDEATRRTLAEIGVPLVQGFHIARPASVRRFSPWTSVTSRRA